MAVWIRQGRRIFSHVKDIITLMSLIIIDHYNVKDVDGGMLVTGNIINLFFTE